MSAPTVTAVYAEESHLYDGRVCVTVVMSDGTTTEKHLTGAVAKRYARSQRAKIGATA